MNTNGTGRFELLSTLLQLIHHRSFTASDILYAVQSPTKNYIGHDRHTLILAHFKRAHFSATNLRRQGRDVPKCSCADGRSLFAPLSLSKEAWKSSML